MKIMLPDKGSLVYNTLIKMQSVLLDWIISLERR